MWDHESRMRSSIMKMSRASFCFIKKELIIKCIYLMQFSVLISNLKEQKKGISLYESFFSFPPFFYMKLLVYISQTTLYNIPSNCTAQLTSWCEGNYANIRVVIRRKRIAKRILVNTIAKSECFGFTTVIYIFMNWNKRKQWVYSSQ